MRAADVAPTAESTDELAEQLRRIAAELPPPPRGQRWVRVLHVYELDDGRGLIEGGFELRPLLRIVR